MLCWTVNLKGAPEGDVCRAAVAVGHKVYYFGGNSNSNNNNRDQIEVHIFNTVSLSWTRLTPETAARGQHQLQVPGRRQNHTAVLIEDIVYMWGGLRLDTRENCNVLYAFTVDDHRWFKPDVSGKVPRGRREHSACVLGKVMYIIGGYCGKPGGTKPPPAKLRLEEVIEGVYFPVHVLQPLGEWRWTHLEPIH